MAEQFDRVIIGNPFPRHSYGVEVFGDVKGFDFSIFLNGVGKRDVLLLGDAALLEERADLGLQLIAGAHEIQEGLELRGPIEVVEDRLLAASRHQDDVLDPRGDRRPDRQHFDRRGDAQQDQDDHDPHAARDLDAAEPV